MYIATILGIKNRLIFPKVKHNFGKDTSRFIMPQVYNMLLDYVMKAESIRSFPRLARNFHK